jgi:hypothetical protein
MPALKLSTRLKITIFAVFVAIGFAGFYLGNPIERFRMNEQQACDEKCKKLNKLSRLVPALPPGTVAQGKYDGPWTCECY